MLDKILPNELLEIIKTKYNISLITEIRIRLYKPIYIAINGVYCRLEHYLYKKCSQSLLSTIIANACQQSLYAYNDEIINGYIPCVGGVRVGVVGEGVVTNGAFGSVKNLTSLCIRIPRQIKGVCREYESIFDDFDNTIILSKAGVGKTTALRESIRLLANKGNNVLVLDERYEISGSVNGISNIDLGQCSDICVGVPKSKSYGNIIRSMRPDIIATDEVFGVQEIDTICDIIRCGTRVIATAHCDDFNTFVQNKEYSKLISNMRYIILLKAIGVVETVYDRKNKICIV